MEVSTQDFLPGAAAPGMYPVCNTAPEGLPKNRRTPQNAAGRRKTPQNAAGHAAEGCKTLQKAARCRRTP